MTQELDNIQRFIFDKADIRGEIVHLNQSYLSIIKHYPSQLHNIIGQALLATVHITASIKFQGRITLQFKSHGPLRLIFAQCDDQFNLRAMARFDENITLEQISESFSEGQLVLNIDQPHQVQSYQSVVPLIDANLALSLEHYFAQSEQIATKLYFHADDTSACGMLLQLMPGSDDSEEREEFWRYATKIGETITADELTHLTNETMLHRLYHETEIRVFERKAVQFKCQCSEEKMKQGIKMLGENDANALLKERGTINTVCEFCRKTYQFDSIDVAMIFKE